ncbi:Proteasome subunit beta type-1, partial [Araneus ventricosus]
SIVAIAGEDYAIIASDTRLSTGYSIYSRNQPKLFKLSDKTVLGSAGCWCDVLTLTRIVEARLKASNVVQDSEKEAYDLEIHNFQNDHFSDIVEESVDLWWRDVENTSKYPLLSRMTFALLTCFHEPKVESK